MLKLVKNSLRLLIVVAGLATLAQAAAAAGPVSSVANAAGQVANQVDQQVVTGGNSASDTQSSTVSSTSSNSTSTTIGPSNSTHNGDGGSGSGNSVVSLDNDGTTISVHDQTSSSADPTQNDQSTNNPALANVTGGSDNNGTGSGTNNAAGGGSSSSQPTNSQSSLLASVGENTTPPTWSHVVMRPTNGILPVSDPTSPMTAPYQPPVPTTPPINPLASTGMLLMFGQFGVSSSSFSTLYQTSFHSLSLGLAGLAGHFIAILSPITKTQASSWLLLAAAILGVGIVALWRRSGYRHAPRSHTLSLTRFVSVLNQSLGVISPNSVFNYLCLPGGAQL